MSRIRPGAVGAAMLMASWLLITGCATGAGSRQDALERQLYQYSSAIRWGNFAAAALFIDPHTLERQPFGAFEQERLKQVQITGYSVLSSAPIGDGGIVREIELNVVNRHTQVLRIERVRESWRWDSEARRWWQTAGLPRFQAD